MQYKTIIFMAGLFVTLLVGGCAHYPLGISEQEWIRLSPEQQYEARQQQATLDLERAKQRQAQLEEQVRAQHERDIAEGMVLSFDEICFGGSRCPGGKNRSHIYNLGGFVFVDKVVFTAHDDIGNKHGATVDVYADHQLITKGIDIKMRGKNHIVFVGAVARNIVLKVRKDDEVAIETFKVFGERLEAGRAHILLKQSQPETP